MTVTNPEYQFHHMGIPTTEKKPNEMYSEKAKMYTSTIGTADFRVQFHRFEEDSPLHPLIKSMPHVAFKVPNLEEALKGKKIIMQPFEPNTGFKAAMIEENGAPIEFIETTLSEDEIWNRDKSKDPLYNKEKWHESD